MNRPMHEELSRLSTFANWPTNSNASPIELARCGFYYSGKGDGVVCFSCAVVLENWTQKHDLLERHKSVSPNCPMAFGYEKENIPLQLPTTVNNVGHAPDVHDGPSEMRILSVYNEAYTRASRRGLFQQTLTASPIDRNNPDFDSLRRESVRLSTYEDWPRRAHAEPRELVKEGFFFTGIDDRVQCAFCRGFLRNWIPGDIPADEHKKHFPECPFVRGLDIGNSCDVNDNVGTGQQKPVAKESKNGVVRQETSPMTTNSPKHPEYSTEARRINSFRAGYLPRGQTVKVLAQAGFYYVGPHDNVRCFHCDGGLENWQADDDPWVEHGHWFPRCAYLTTQRDQMFIQAAQVPRNRISDTTLLFYHA